MNATFQQTQFDSNVKTQNVMNELFEKTESPQKNIFTYLNQYDSVVLFSTADWNNPFWTNKQHTAVQLRDAGFKVLYIESLALRQPTLQTKDLSRIFKRIKSFFSGPREVQKNIFVFSPLVLPWHKYKLISALNYILLLFTLKLYIKKYKFQNSIGWTYNPIIFKILKALKFKFNIYHSVDDLSAAPKINKETIEQSEKELFQYVDLTFVTSLTLKEKYETLSIFKHKKNTEIIYLSNVADYDHFSKYNHLTNEEKNNIIPEVLKNYTHPRIGFIGAISSYKVDFKFLNQLAQQKPNWNIFLIGEIGEGDPDTNPELLKVNNIHLLGPKKYQDLPLYLLGFDFTILPCPINKYTEAMFPMKFFEYLAAQKLILSTALPSLQELKDCYLEYRNIDEFIIAADKILLKQVTYSERMKTVAQKYTWQNRLQNMFAEIEKVMSKSIYLNKNVKN